MSGRAMLTPRLSKLGRVALVTGASDGIGRATAEALAREGFDLIVTARREPALQALAERLRRDTGVSVDVVPADLASAAGVDTLLSALSTRDVGVAVLAAGFGSAGAFAKGDIATEQTMLALNCGAVLTLTHALSARMIA
ncbi:MAG: SDR family NAD(P)-dependent oxidoreductase, partial [Pseudomonadota bacterium]